MPVNISGQSYLRLLDFSTEQIEYLLKLSKNVKDLKRTGYRCSGRFISQDCRQIYRNPKNRGVCEQGCS